MKNKKHLFVILVISLLLLTIFSSRWTHKNVATLQFQQTSTLAPIVMVPGSNATQNRFDDLVAKLNQQTKQSHSLLKVTVNRQGHLHYTGHFKPGTSQPIIVIGFVDNRDGFRHIIQQAGWFEVALRQLMQQYQFSRVDVIGHSNGGLIITYFLEHDNHLKSLKINKLMTIAAPYNLNETTTTGETTMLRSLIANRQNIPKPLSVYSVAGSQTVSTDGLVPLYSVLAGRFVYQGQVRHFTELTVTGGDTEHSDLPQNDQIVQLIRNFIVK